MKDFNNTYFIKVLQLSKMSTSEPLVKLPSCIERQTVHGKSDLFQTGLIAAIFPFKAK